jgi:hypothetical protein
VGEQREQRRDRDVGSVTAASVEGELFAGCVRIAVRKVARTAASHAPHYPFKCAVIGS